MGILFVFAVIGLCLIIGIVDSIKKWHVERKYRKMPKITKEQQELIDKHIESLFKKNQPLQAISTEKITSLFASYPHGVAYLAAKYLYVHIDGVNMPSCYVDEQGHMDSSFFLATCGMKSIKDIKELTHSQISTLLLHSDEFPEKERYVLQQLDYENICLEFKNKITKDALRSKYYIEFLENHYITNHKLISIKKYCLKNIDSFDSFIYLKEKKKKEKEREFYKLCEDLNLNKVIEEERKFYEDLNLNVFNEKEYENEYFTRITNSVSSWKLKIKGIPYYFFYHYYPTRFTDISNASRNVRGLIYDFKDGKRHGNVVNILSQKLRSTFHNEDFKHLCFVCIPASNVHDNNCRYRSFAEELCSTLGMSNGFEHIKITKEKTKSHLGGTDSAEYYIDGNFFKDKNVILFDDVVTRGHSMQEFKELLEAKGATIICALSIGRTYSDYYGDHREPHPWTNEL